MTDKQKLADDKAATKNKQVQIRGDGYGSWKSMRLRCLNKNNNGEAAAKNVRALKVEV